MYKRQVEDLLRHAHAVRSGRQRAKTGYDLLRPHHGEPLVGDDTPAGQAFFNVCRRILGEEVSLMELDRTQGFLSRISGLFHRNR